MVRSPACRRLLAGAVLLLATTPLATGCADDRAVRTAPPAELPSSTPSTTGSDSASPEPEGDPKETFRDARLQLLSANTGFYRVSTVLGPITILTQGQYDLARKATSGRVSLTDSDRGQMVVDSVVIGRTGWVRFVSGLGLDQPSCWFSVADMARVAIETDAPQAGLLAGEVSGVPLPLEVVLRGKVDRWDGERLLGRSSLFGLSGTVSPRFSASLGLDDYETTGRVTFELTDGRLTGWRARLGDILQDADRAGLVIPESLQVYRQHKDAMGGVSVLLTQTGRDLTIERPAPDLVVEPVADDKEFERRLSSCPEE